MDVESLHYCSLLFLISGITDPVTYIVGFKGVQAYIRGKRHYRNLRMSELTGMDVPRTPFRIKLERLDEVDDRAICQVSPYGYGQNPSFIRGGNRQVCMNSTNSNGNTNNDRFTLTTTFGSSQSFSSEVECWKWNMLPNFILMISNTYKYNCN